MIIAATGYFKVVDSVGIRVAGEIIEPIPQRVVLRMSDRPRRYQVGVQRQDEALLRGCQVYSTLAKAWGDFEEYTGELVEDGYMNSAPRVSVEGPNIVIDRKG
jgi:hypothetical protein